MQSSTTPGNGGKTPSQGHKAVRSSLKAIQTALRINDQQQELVKKAAVSAGANETSEDLDKLESKAKKKIENFTQKAKEFPKNFKDTSKNQIVELSQTFKQSLREKKNKGKNTNTPTLSIQDAEKEVDALQRTYDGIKDEGPAKVKARQDLNKAKSELRKLQLQKFSAISDASATEALRNIMIQTMNRVSEEVKTIIQEEYIGALGCSQEQEYLAGDIYIKVKNIDIFGKTLQQNPYTKPGKYLYELAPFSPDSIPRAFNKDLWKRIQDDGKSYQQEYGTGYLGASGQELFDIVFVKDPLPNLNGEYYKVNLKNRQGSNAVVEFLADYFNSIDIVNYNELFANVMNLLLGAIDMSKFIGYDDLRSQSVFEKIIQRILGLCFDNTQEIDVSGSGKLDTLDQIDSSFFILAEDDLAEIENKIKNIQERVVQFKDCGAIYFPVNVDGSLNLLDEFNEGIEAPNADAAAQNMLDKIASNQEWLLLYPQFGNFWEIFNMQFINLVPTAVVNSVLSPKHLFPLFVMGKALQKEYIEGIETPEDYLQEFRKMVINIVSKIQAIFVKALVDAIKANLKLLMRNIVRKTLNEVLTNENKITLQGINIALTALQAAVDFRRCKSVVDELQQILNLSNQIKYARKAKGATIPAYVNYAAAASKVGMSSIGMLTKIVEKMDNTGVPTGDLPSGSPNLGLIMMKNITDSIIEEVVDNGKTVVSITQAESALIASGAAVVVPGNVL